MKPTPSSAAEQLSCLADGQLDGADLAQALQRCELEPDLLKTWRDYQLIGEVLRGVSLSAPSDEARFLDRLRPALLAQPSPPAPPALASASHAPRLDAANEPRFRWGWAAAVALVAGLAWSLGSEFTQGDAGFAAGESPLWETSPHGVILRDAALQELLDAHRQQGGAEVMPMPSGFLRNATFDPAPASPGGGAAAGR